MFLLEKKKAKEVAAKFGYTESTIYTLARNFYKKLKQNDENPFFIKNSVGRKTKQETDQVKEIIIALRKKYFSVQIMPHKSFCVLQLIPF